jgi:1,4-dihydroxy-2-naphthoate octaprenyltransferase
MPSLIRGWVIMARIPFHSVGVMPFILGAVLAWKTHHTFNPAVFCMSLLAVILIMLTTYAAGEFYDQEEDRLTATMEKNYFSGGSQAVVKGMIPPGLARLTSWTAAIGAGIVGLVLQFVCHTGPWTIPLGIIGLMFGFFYSTEPVRLVKRGVGEVVIGFCYGWLPVATSYYLQTSSLTPLVHWMSIPIALSIFNVILINEYPDYPADLIEGKANLLVRLGKKTCATIYAAAGLGTFAGFAMAVHAGMPPVTWVFLPVIAVLSICPSLEMLRRGYLDRTKLEKMCAITLVLNLSTTGAFIAGLLL